MAYEVTVVARSAGKDGGEKVTFAFHPHEAIDAITSLKLGDQLNIEITAKIMGTGQ